MKMNLISISKRPDNSHIHFIHTRPRILIADFTRNIELCINEQRNATLWYASQTMYRRSETAFNRYN
jgi:hypothetical protein